MFVREVTDVSEALVGDIRKHSSILSLNQATFTLDSIACPAFPGRNNTVLR